MAPDIRVEALQHELIGLGEAAAEDQSAGHGCRHDARDGAESFGAERVQDARCSFGTRRLHQRRRAIVFQRQAPVPDDPGR